MLENPYFLWLDILGRKTSGSLPAPPHNPFKTPRNQRYTLFELGLTLSKGCPPAGQEGQREIVRKRPQRRLTTASKTHPQWLIYSQNKQQRAMCQEDPGRLVDPYRSLSRLANLSNVFTSKAGITSLGTEPATTKKFLRGSIPCMRLLQTLLRFLLSQ